MAPSSHVEGGDATSGVPVTQATYCRAESDRTFHNITTMAGGVNRFFHFRNVTPLDDQTVIRMNKDTLYSGAVVDTSSGATITVPEMPEGRYVSVLLIDNDHYCPGVIYCPGAHPLPTDTKYLLTVVRIQLLRPDDPADIALVNRLQDQFVITAGSADPFPAPQWDPQSLAALTAAYNAEARKFERYPAGWMGPRGAVDEATRHIGCAGAWGLFPNQDAIYINYNGNHSTDQGYAATYAVPENTAFWSITVYGADGYMKHANSVLNAFNTTFNADGTFTVSFGSREQCGDVPNRLDVTDGWNFLMRIYRPGPSVLNGSYILPAVAPITTMATTGAAARTIAKEAYIYGFPIVDNLRIQHSYFVDQTSPEYKAPYNQLVHIPRVYTPADTAVQTANSDTPYSWIGLDLRAEPLVFTLPPIAHERYFSVQLIDLYTHNFDYLGSRTTGNDGGHFLIAGPGWQGEMPTSISKLIRCETAIAMALFRTQLFTVDDLENVKQIQAQYAVQPLSAFLGRPAPAAAPAIAFPAPLTPAAQKTSLEFFSLLNFGLQFCPTHPSERELMARFATIGIGAGLNFDPGTLAPEMKQAIEQGMADAWADFAAGLKLVKEGKLTSGDAFGTREFLENNYLYRMLGAVLGIYGNTQAEAIYPTYYVDADGQQLNGAHCYTLRFGPGQLPPVNSFWSLTMYAEPEKLLVANPLNRYLLNSAMLAQFKQDADGGLTLLIQHESPGKDNEANWLPAPEGSFSMIMRLYWPRAAALDGSWKAPPLKQV
ncbi:MAG: DUF1254 domain-containing protein [Chloroflexales bacterium]|nr:DUF1254 domain-containing protein [Chloroflexales bacterium]